MSHIPLPSPRPPPRPRSRELAQRPAPVRDPSPPPLALGEDDAGSQRRSSTHRQHRPSSGDSRPHSREVGGLQNGHRHEPGGGERGGVSRPHSQEGACEGGRGGGMSRPHSREGVHGMERGSSGRPRSSRPPSREQHPGTALSEGGGAESGRSSRPQSREMGGGGGGCGTQKGAGGGGGAQSPVVPIPPKHVPSPPAVSLLTSLPVCGNLLKVGSQSCVCIYAPCVCVCRVCCWCVFLCNKLCAAVPKA